MCSVQYVFICICPQYNRGQLYKNGSSIFNGSLRPLHLVSPKVLSG